MSKSVTFSLNRKISQILASERKRRGITQADIAKKLKKPQSFVSKYENGQRQLTVADFIGACNALALRPADFFKILDKN
jgi:transcriptional regulator with XRE-family HTH domain